MAVSTSWPATCTISSVFNKLPFDAVQFGAKPDQPSLDEATFHAPPLVGTSTSMLAIKDDLVDVAPYSTTVLVLGETGVGKEVVARQIHAQSPRRNNPFIAVNCGSFNENLIESELFGHMGDAFTGAKGYKKGIFENADGGTVFLDEVQSLPDSAQVKLLRATNERRISPVGSGGKEFEINCRLVVAANADLKTMVDEGTFREDLYHRLMSFAIKLPPLRERMEDLPLFIPRLVEVLRERDEIPDLAFTLEPDAVAYLSTLQLKGNVRQLKAMIGIAALKAKPKGRTALTLDDMKAAAHRYEAFALLEDDVPDGYVRPDFKDFEAIQRPTLAQVAESGPWKQAVVNFRNLYFAQLWHTMADRRALKQRVGSADVSNQLRNVGLNTWTDRIEQRTPAYQEQITSATNPKTLDLSQTPVVDLAQLSLKDALKLFTGVFIYYNGQNCTAPSTFRKTYGSPTGFENVMKDYGIELGKS
jgi:transcriptional regulator with GAF, ATPase, and Fis domain